MEDVRGTVCVTGGTGYVASWLILRLLQHGYSVRATVRSSLADLNNPETFNEAIQGCTGVFHLAHPIDVEGKEPEEVVTKRALEGTLGILKACLDSKTVKRVVYTSSLATILFNSKGLEETDENTWSEVDACRSNKLVSSSYLVSKTGQPWSLQRGMVWILSLWFCLKYLDLSFVQMFLLRCDQEQCEYLVSTYMVHIDDAASAHIFLLEHANAKGSHLMESKCYKGTTVSSMKLLNAGFKFKCGIGEMFDGAIQSCKDKGFL
ncbi:hypothetical protein ACLB2K_072266 [Fragaria x ananassa]